MTHRTGADRAQPDIPATLGPYRVDGVIGSGGMGVVYRATAPDGSRVALKTLQPHMVAPHQHGRFEREASIRVDHPNVIRVLGSGAAENGAPFIALELLEGCSLEDRLKREKMTLDELLPILRQACAGLAAVHAKGIVHRDLKPANLFLCTDGVVKVLDFGVAQVATGPKLTVEGTVLGSVSYLSPEQARGRSDLDPSTDVWAMGVVIYEALTGEAPFDRDTPLTTVLAIIQGKYVPLRARAPFTPRDLAAIVDRCLSLSPHARFADGAALATVLGAIAAHAVEVSTAETVVARASLVPGEERVVVVVLARHVVDPGKVEAIVTELGGEAIPFLGEGVIGIFGAREWAGDEVDRAVEAGLRCRAIAREVAVGSGRAHSTGTDVSGAAVMAAERGCAARLDGVALDADTARAVRDRHEIRAVDGGLFEIASSRRSAPAASPIVGRVDQLARVRELIDSWRDLSIPHVLDVRGPLGIGKTRLRREIEHIAAGSDEVVVLSGRGEPIRSAVALHLWSAVFSNHLRLRRPDATEDTSRAAALLELARATIADRDAASIHALFLRDLLRLPGPEPGPLLEARADPQLMSDRLQLAILEYVCGLAQRGPMLIVLEDLQWADRASLDLLERLAGRVTDDAVLFVLTSRTGVVDTDMGALGAFVVERIELGPLDVDAALALARSASGPAVSDAVIAELVARAEGNPFFVEQMARSMAERGAETDSADVPLPSTVEGALQSRLDRLPDDARDLARRASVLERPFLAEEAAALGASAVAPSLEILLHRDILATAPTATGETEYTFKSPLMAAVTYDLLTPAVRTELHALAASYLEHARGIDPEEAARHHEHAAAHARASSCYAASALLAVTRGDSDTVLRCTGEAFALGAPADRLYELHMARVEALRFLGRRPEQEADLDAALAHASNDRERARALTEKVSLLSWLGRRAAALELVPQAVAMARASDDGEALVLALGRSAELLVLEGKGAEAEPLLREAMNVVRAGHPRLESFVEARRALWADSRGDVNQSLAAWQRALELFRAGGALRLAAAAQQNLAECYNKLGAYTEAEVALREALHVCRQTGHRVHEAYALANLGNALVNQGKFTEALPTLELAGARAEAMHDERLALYVRVYRANALSGAGRLAEAQASACEAADSAAAAGREALEILARTAAARASLTLGDVERALRESQRALELRDRMDGLEEGEGEVFLVRALALEAAGEAEAAREIRRAGAKRVKAVAARIRDSYWRQRFLNDVHAHRELLASKE